MRYYLYKIGDEIYGNCRTENFLPAPAIEVSKDEYYASLDPMFIEENLEIFGAVSDETDPISILEDMICELDMQNAELEERVIMTEDAICELDARINGGE